MEPFIVPATLGALSPIGKYVLDAATAAGLDKKAAYRLRLAVDEIATNAMVHGHAESNPPGTLQVLAELGPQALTIILEDTGNPYDPRQAPRPEHLDQPLEERPIGGLGVYLVLQGVDEFLYERIGERNRNIFVMRQLGPASEETLESDKLAYDLLNVIIPIGMALSGEKNFDVLLELILTQAKAVCNADGGTLYLRDGDFLKFAIMRNDTLQIAIGGPTGKAAPIAALRLYDEDGAPNYANVASYVALQGHSINISDIYNAKDFDFSGTRAFDQQNNYQSISTFTVPLTNHSSEVIGVLQLLNAQDPQTREVIPFDAYMQKLVEALASQASIVLNNQILLERQKDLLRVEHELQIGRQIQTSFLPTLLPEVPGWEIAANFYPAREVAGDFYDAFYLQDSTKVCLVIADVCDKGVGAALFMALTRSLIHAFAEWQETGLGNPIEFTNEYILRNHLQANMFITLFFGVLDPSTGLLTYVNSGHNPPAIIGTAGVKTHLQPTGPATGIFPDWTFQTHEVYLEPGDMLFAFTDGVTEARNSDGDFFTDKRLLQLLEEPAASAAALLQRVEENVRSHIAFADQSDDITMLIARRKLPHES